MREFSFGCGVQSMAVLVMAALKQLQYDVFLFSNVGEDSEHPDTLRYFREIAVPYASANGIEMIELTGKTTLRQRLVGENRSIAIPVRMSNGAPGRRSCTSDFKIRRISSWLRKHGATKANPAVVGLGISVDEFHRARTDSGILWEVLEYPLLDARMTRADCTKMINSVGLPVPPKSSCYFCPFHSPANWLNLKRERPDLFADAVAIEKRINAKRGAIGRDIVYMHPALVPLDQAVGDQGVLWDDMSVCESGYCFV